jgi:hypothetical protein
MTATGMLALALRAQHGASHVCLPAAISYYNRMSAKRRISDERVAALLGLAFDAKDGHKRITRGSNFLLAGGSEETHGLMRETIIRVNERLEERGLDLADVTAEELRDLLNE